MRAAPRRAAAAAAANARRLFARVPSDDGVGAYVRLDTRVCTYVRARINKTRDTRARRVCVKDGAPRSITGQPFLRHYSERARLRDGRRKRKGRGDNEPEKSAVRFSDGFWVMISSTLAPCTFVDDIADRHVSFVHGGGGISFSFRHSVVEFLSSVKQLGYYYHLVNYRGREPARFSRSCYLQKFRGRRGGERPCRSPEG